MIHHACHSHFLLAKPTQVISYEVNILTSRASNQHNTIVIGLLGKLLGTAGSTDFTCEDHVKYTRNMTNCLGGVGGYILLVFAVGNAAISGISQFRSTRFRPGVRIRSEVSPSETELSQTKILSYGTSSH